jgi:hypothetical protein
VKRHSAFRRLVEKIQYLRQTLKAGDVYLEKVAALKAKHPFNFDRALEHLTARQGSMGEKV